MSANTNPGPWNDLDGAYFEIGGKTFGPYLSEEEAELAFDRELRAVNPGTSIYVNITDGDGVLLCRHKIAMEEIVAVVTEIGLKHGELRGARAVLDAASEVGSLVTDEIIAAIARYRNARRAA